MPSPICGAPMTGARRHVMTLNNYSAVAAIAGMLVLGSAGKALAADEVKPASRALTGTWLVQVQQRICATQEPLGDAFYALLTSARGGTMRGPKNAPIFSPGPRTRGFCAWRFRRPTAVSAVSETFLPAGSPSNPPR